MPGMSSVAPLQSLSTASHVSGDFITPPMQTRPPALHTNAPALQRVPTIAPVCVFVQPLKSPDGQHAWLSQLSVSASSVVPLQSLSRESHTSGAGPIDPRHVST